ncbi:nucleotide exchange factor GrpE [Mesoplasma lactucae]|uniref:Protein GrpE n=1 Tax=Mesoplasma lactucae ATCC 49193 TaxID=81460 RepID=A0A291IRI1_9MOLU|nr:nucleotide exchange factor GrpE [Mesoplasma lactucae]ATG97334.1 nucleotide exchange factor GrpE [Mesoplasma lactucae ATCC 49193]ATZ20215.1 heat shock protein GrpE [Mesoplasma lactucae ATCC 49193]MCL8216964.1 Protein GrpE [Mesoplasma lactucae ATCC 49193]
MKDKDKKQDSKLDDTIHEEKISTEQSEEKLEPKVMNIFKAHPDDENLQIIQQYVDSLNKEIDLLNNEVKSVVADNRNTIKRRDDQEQELRKYGAKKLGEAIVPDIELFRTVLKTSENNASAEVQNYLKGFEMVITRMDDALSQVGIKEMNIKLGSEADSHTMNITDVVESDEYDEGQVVKVVSNGYTIYDKVLIHANVQVAGKKPSKEEEK